MLDEVGLERAADAAVLQGNQAVVFLAYHTTFGNQVGVDVDFTQIVDNHGEADAAPVVEDAVDQGGFTAAEVTGQQEDRDFFQIFHFSLLFFLKMLIILHGIPGPAPLEAVGPEKLAAKVFVRNLVREVDRAVGILLRAFGQDLLAFHIGVL